MKKYKTWGVSDLFLDLLILFNVHECFVCIHARGVCGGQKKASNPLQLKSQMIVRCCVVLETEPRDSARIMNSLNPWVISTLLNRKLSP